MQLGTSKVFVLQGSVPDLTETESPLLRGSWDLVTMVVNKVTILITGYNPS